MSDTRSNSVDVVVCERNAIYVDGTRITHRGTKWGMRATLSSFSCPNDQVVKKCLDLGFPDHVKAIDTEPYIAQRSAVADTALPNSVPDHA